MSTENLVIPISCFFFFLGGIQGQQCCVWTNFTQAISSPAPQAAPDSSCSGSYSWTPCSSGCIQFSCTRLHTNYYSQQTNYYSATCDPSSIITAAAVKSMFMGDYAAGSCNRSEGITRETDATEPPLTASTVTSAAAAGSVGGSIAGTLIASILSWFLNHFGDAILQFVLGKA